MSRSTTGPSMCCFYFVQNPGKALTRDELLKNVWPDTFVDENSLAQSISVLRRALEEKPGDNNYIVTLPGRGYQFVSPVQVVASEDASTLPEAGNGRHQGPQRADFSETDDPDQRHHSIGERTAELASLREVGRSGDWSRF